MSFPVRPNPNLSQHRAPSISSRPRRTRRASSKSAAPPPSLLTPTSTASPSPSPSPSSQRLPRRAQNPIRPPQRTLPLLCSQATMLDCAILTFKQMEEELNVSRSVKSLIALLFTSLLAKNYKEVGISIARLLSLDGTWQSLAESFSKNVSYIVSTVLWVYWGVCISDLIPFYLGKLFRQSGVSDDVSSKVGYGLVPCGRSCSKAIYGQDINYKWISSTHL